MPLGEYLSRLVWATTILAVLGVMVAVGEPLLVVVPIGSSLVGVGSLLFDFLTWRK